MRRVVMVLLALFGLALLVGSLMVWKEPAVVPPITESEGRQRFGPQERIGTSALSHGAPALPRRPRSMSDYPITKAQGNAADVSGSDSP